MTCQILLILIRLNLMPFISWQVFNETNIQGSYQVTLSSGQLLEKHTVDAHGHSAITGGDYTGATITNTGNTSLNLKIN